MNAISVLESSGAEIVDSLFFPEEVIETKGSIYTRIRWPEFKAQIPDYLVTIGEEYPKTLAEIIEIVEKDDFFLKPIRRVLIYLEEKKRAYR